LCKDGSLTYEAPFQVVYETKGAGDDLMMSGSEVVVANEEEVGEHEQVTVHYISADGITGTPKMLTHLKR